MLKLRTLINLFFYKKGFLVKLKFFDVKHTFNGFYFLSFYFFRTKNSLCSGSISNENLQIHKFELKKIIKNFSGANFFMLLKRINTNIINWKILYQYSDFFLDLCSEMDLYVYRLLWKFVKKYHTRRSNTWIYSKYWKYIFGSWKFFIFDSNTGKVNFLESHFNVNNNKLKFYRLPNSLNVFDFFNENKLNSILFKRFLKNFSPTFQLLWNKQSGLCFCCRRLMQFNKFFDLKLIYKYNHKSALNNLNNFVLIHSYCSS